MSDIDRALKGKHITPFIAAAVKSELEDDMINFFDIVLYPQLTYQDSIRHIDIYGIVIYRRKT